MTTIPELSDHDFKRLTVLIEQLTGIRMTDKKRALVAGRLAKRLRHYGFNNYSRYFELLKSAEGAEELSIFVDLITTHVTHFFREPEHFSFLSTYLSSIKANRNDQHLKIWCAACSTGEEVYSIALIVADRYGSQNWSILGTDISTESVQRASLALYPIQQVEEIPDYYLKNYALKGKGSQAGHFTFDRSITENCKFQTLNLNENFTLPDGFQPDIVFLRNVMIYFENDVRRNLILRINRYMKHSGLLFLGHAETLNALNVPFEYVRPAVYRRIQ